MDVKKIISYILYNFEVDKVQPKITIIVPVYNVEKYLSRCIKSLEDQKYSNMEIILIDDGSTDDSGKICDVLKKDYSNIKVIHQKNKGVSSARNAGLKIATGEYIGFVDPDDYIEKNMYAKLYQSLIDTNADIAICGVTNEFEDGRSSFVLKGIDKLMSNEDAIRYDISHGIYYTCNKLFSKKTCENIFYDEEIINGEDRLFDVMTLLKAKKVIYISNPYYHYYHRANSAGTKKYTPQDRSLINACEKIKDLLIDKGNDLRNMAEAQIDQAYVFLLWMMRYKIDEYKPDSECYVKKIRNSLLRIILNKHNGIKFKIKVVLLCISPFLLRAFYMLKS